MLAAGQPQAAPAQVKSPQAEKAAVAGADGKTLEAKSSADTSETATQAAAGTLPGAVAGNISGNQAGVAKQITPEMMQARAAASAGTKAGATVAGLQSRNVSSDIPTNSTSRAVLEGTHSMKEWVFDGVEGNPNLRSLFGAQAGAAKGGENLLNQVQSEQQVRGDTAMGAPTGASAQSMTSSQENSLLQGGGMALPANGLGHIAIERSHPNVVNANGSSALSGAEYLNTLSQLSMKKDGNAGSFGREGGKAGLKAGANLGEVKKAKSALGGEDGFDALSQSGAAASGISGSTLLNGMRTEVTGKSAEAPGFVQAQVTTGSMAQDRIASASLAGISSNIRNFSAQGGGEIRVKLHPENLGELHLRIVTDGKQVGLHVQATDDKARKILEESLSDLKESLSKHQLSLGQVDFSVGQAQGAFSGDMSGDSKQKPSHQSFGSFNGNMQDMMNSGGNQSNGWAGAQDGSAAREGWNGSPLRTAMPGGRVAAQAAGASRTGLSSAGGVATRRLDIRA